MNDKRIHDEISRRLSHIHNLPLGQAAHDLTEALNVLEGRDGDPEKTLLLLPLVAHTLGEQAADAVTRIQSAKGTIPTDDWYASVGIFLATALPLTAKVIVAQRAQQG